jgi:hypothetical protein
VTGDEAFRPARILRQSDSQPASPYINIIPTTIILTLIPTHHTYSSYLSLTLFLRQHDEYWHPHVDTEQYQSFAYTALLYLSDHGADKDFVGGAFEFVDQPKSEGRTVLPARGRLLVFTSGAENRHRVTRLRTGERLALTVPFTCNPADAVGPGWLDEAWASTRRGR